MASWVTSLGSGHMGTGVKVVLSLGADTTYLPSRRALGSQVSLIGIEMYNSVYPLYLNIWVSC